MAGKTQKQRYVLALLLSSAAQAAEPRPLVATDKLTLSVATMELLQAQLFESDAKLQLADAQAALQGALMRFDSVDAARAGVIAAKVRLAPLAQESQRLDAMYQELVRALREEYKAAGCTPTLRFAWQCGAQPGQPAQPSTPPAQSQPGHGQGGSQEGAR